MDPVTVLPEELHKNIFQYFTGQELLHLSTVSKSWYSVIGNNVDCMKKLEIRYKLNQGEPNIDLLLKSTRQYQNIEISSNYFTDMVKGTGINGARKILRKFAPSINYLSTRKDFQRLYDMPKLKTLIYRTGSPYRHYDPPLYSNGIFSKAKNLEYLSVANINDRKSSKIVKDAVKSMNKLKTLIFNSRMDDDYITFDLNITEFCTTEPIEFGKAICNFIQRHASILETLRLNFIDHASLEYILTSCPKLTTLKFDDYSLKDGFRLPVNNTIKELKISEYKLDFLDYFKALEVMKIDCIFEDKFTRIARSTASVTVVYASWINIELIQQMQGHPTIKFVCSHPQLFWEDEW